MSEEAFAEVGSDSVSQPVSHGELGHPRGTLAILLIYAALFVLGWAFLYFVEFLPRGAPQP